MRVLLLFVAVGLCLILQFNTLPFNTIHFASASANTTLAHGANTTNTQLPAAKGHLITVSNITIPLNLKKPIRVELKATDSDKNDTLAFYIVRFPAHGILSGVTGQNMTGQKAFNITYTPQSTSFSDNFTYMARDPTDHLNSVNNATVILNVNHPPTVFDRMITSNGTKPVKVILAGSDPDKGDKLTFSIVQLPLNGLLTNASGNSSMYSPNAEFIGLDKFTYRAKDSAGLSSNNGTVSVNVVKPPSLNVTGPIKNPIPAQPNWVFFTLVVVLALVALVLIIPLLLTLGKSVPIHQVYRLLVAVGVILTVVLIIVWLNSIIFYGFLPTAETNTLLETQKNFTTIIGTAFASLVAFYFGTRGTQAPVTRQGSNGGGGTTPLPSKGNNGGGGTTQLPSKGNNGGGGTIPGKGESRSTNNPQNEGPTYEQIDRLARLADLRRNGALTDDEFHKLKTKLLETI
jgi:hypothetical protein